MVDINFCASSYLTYRYIEREGVEFSDKLHHRNFKPIAEDKRVLVGTVDEIDVQIKKQMDGFKDMKCGVLLSGGMDSAIVASYLGGADAYTFRFLGGSIQKEELQRAEYFSSYYGLNLHYVDINWETAVLNINPLMKAKGAPVHSIEPQILQAALQAKNDGIEIMFVGESSDLIFGGMDKLLAKDWQFDEFVARYTFLDPKRILKEPVDVSYLFERYREEDKIDFLGFMDDVFSIESSGSYYNAFGVADMAYYDPYACLKMSEPLDLYRIRNGEPKYLIRELMKKKYPEIPVPNKIPMPRPVDEYFKKWDGPKRSEFRDDINLEELSGDQKWQVYCLEEFLNSFIKL